jgi:ATP citrate (pro-S)-lyase
MSAKPIPEFDGKHLLSHHLLKVPLLEEATAKPGQETAFEQQQGSLLSLPPLHLASISIDDEFHGANDEKSPKFNAFQTHLKALFESCESTNPWLSSMKLVVKPDQLIKRRGKNGLLGINLDWQGVQKWITERAGKSIKVISCPFELPL